MREHSHHKVHLVVIIELSILSNELHQQMEFVHLSWNCSFPFFSHLVSSYVIKQSKLKGPLLVHILHLTAGGPIYVCVCVCVCVCLSVRLVLVWCSQTGDVCFSEMQLKACIVAMFCFLLIKVEKLLKLHLDHHDILKPSVRGKIKFIWVGCSCLE